jgi:pyruvate dehydrogenase E2 component (dihydrolipoamide acetyltransferase)
MPKLSDSMSEGTVLRWLKQNGESVAVGEELVEIETDKATVVFEAESAGVLRILADEGQTLEIGAPIAEIGDDGASPAAPRAVADGAVRQDTPRAVADGVVRRDTPRPRASPVARRLARALGVDLEGVSATGPGGRIVKRDVEAVAGASEGVAEAASGDGRPVQRAVDASRGGVERRVLTPSQATVARRMTQVQTTAPAFTLTSDVEMDALLSFRGDSTGSDEIRLPSITDFVVRAAALALRAHPDVNAGFVDGVIERYERINVGIAVAGDGTLLVPTIFDADRKTLGQIATESRSLAQRARDGKLRPDEVSGGTFTISNLGMYGVTQFAAMLNPPQAAILAVGSLREQVVLTEGQPAARQLMSATLTCDHRVLYGADGASFLQSVRLNLELPIRLAL